jgi:hypothetical protein
MRRPAQERTGSYRRIGAGDAPHTVAADQKTGAATGVSRIPRVKEYVPLAVQY